MTEQNKGRPFAAGDMVVSNEFGIGHVLNVTRHGYVDALFGSTRQTFDMQGRYEKDKPPDIKCIRKPRKGGKEARDIVAIVGRDYHDYMLHTLRAWLLLCGDEGYARKEYWRQRKIGSFKNKAALFEKAKSML